MVIPTIASGPQLSALRNALSKRSGVVHVSGLWGSSAPMVIAQSASGATPVCLYVTAHLEEADQARDDLELFLGRGVEIFPAWDTLPGEGPAAGEILAERLRLCGKLVHAVSIDESKSTIFVAAPVQSLLQPVPAPDDLAHSALHLSIGPSGVREDVSSPTHLLTWLVEHGFERLERVESPGDVARRGDLVDVFVPGDEQPLRIQFDENMIESIRRFDASSQRSIETLDHVDLTALVSEPTTHPDRRANLIDYLPADTIVVLDDPVSLHEMGRIFLSRLGESPLLFPIDGVLAGCNRFQQVHLSRFGSAPASGESAVHFPVASLARFEGGASDVVSELIQVARDRVVYVICDNEGERARLRDMISEQSADSLQRIHLTIGVMHRGFEWIPSKTVVLSHHELFHRHRQRRRIRRLHAGRPLESFAELTPGELVVHLGHGIAMYRGLKTMRKGESEQQEEFLTLEFADKAVVHVPCSQIELVQRYIGVPGRKPKLSALGGKRWSKTKEQVAEAVTELAESLLRVQAIRDSAVGTAYPPDTDWQREFEASFLYEETEDQLQVAGEIKSDLTRQRPMDRLVCGDVGYGKTELAMRAAFKVVEYGRQVAVLVPTTVLAEQHYETFTDRMADYPFKAGCLSRFRTNSEQKKILEQARKGQIDIVVGTHRLLSKDVRFANLGLVIIDEEQRFGVEHKERLKQMRETVDVLTLTATPIPRTLHMSLSGLRDISMLQTPPVDRRAIATQVRPWDEALIREAIIRELNREGQVFFVHNYVHSIASMADTVRRIAPEARVVYGHGQMPDDELESVMHGFLNRQADVLVSTTIIESGIDIPSANTILINRADRFGLADLHQLRGRVGRSHHRAYCYLLLSPDRPLTSKAAKRLKTIEEFSELGAGFRIALRDLEIRGAGNLLGKEQSGNIAAVGYDLYCRMLDQTVRRLKNEPDPLPPPLHVDLDVAAYIPRNYVDSDRSRIDVYRRMGSSLTVDDLALLEKDLKDAYGPIPQVVDRLLQLAEIRVLARKFGVHTISLRPPDVVFQVSNLPTSESLFADAPGSVRVADQKTVHLRLPPSYLEPGTLLPVLRRMLKRAESKTGVSK